MFKKETVVYILRHMNHRRKNPTRRDKFFILFIGFATGCMVVFLFAFLVSGSDLFGWLFEAARAAILLIFVIGFAWWIYDIMKQSKQIELDTDQRG